MVQASAKAKANRINQSANAEPPVTNADVRRDARCCLCDCRRNARTGQPCGGAGGFDVAALIASAFDEAALV